MSKIGCFQIDKGRVGDIVNMVNIHVSFLFNIINIMGGKLWMNKPVGKLSHSAPYTLST